MLETKTPREQAGRDAFARYKAQIRSAAIASLSILDGGEIDRIYCDFHDDFVARINKNGQHFYLFYQVKTHGRKNHLWTINELFGINIKKIKYIHTNNYDKLKDSFVGKLLLHTVNFGDKCKSVVFQTNVNFDNKLDDLIDNIRKKEFSGEIINFIIDSFIKCFSDKTNREIDTDYAKECLLKFNEETDVQYLKESEGNFEPIAKEKIYKYSEIDLTHEEAREILSKLIELVEKKSSGIIKELNSKSIEERAGISIENLLEILSISKESYEILLKGGDGKALKNASIIQRTLLKGGANMEMVNYCSQCKIKWDNWLRKNRHIVPEFDFFTLTSELLNILSSAKMNNSGILLSFLKKPIEDLLDKFRENIQFSDLTKDELLGGIFSELVRGKS